MLFWGMPVLCAAATSKTAIDSESRPCFPRVTSVIAAVMALRRSFQALYSEECHLFYMGDGMPTTSHARTRPECSRAPSGGGLVPPRGGQERGAIPITPRGCHR